MTLSIEMKDGSIREYSDVTYFEPRQVEKLVDGEIQPVGSCLYFERESDDEIGMGTKINDSEIKDYSIDSGLSNKKRECMKKLIVCETDKGKWAVRPAEWAGVWNEKGQIKESLNHIALFSHKEDAEKFVEWKDLEEQGLLPNKERNIVKESQMEDRLAELAHEDGFVSEYEECIEDAAEPDR